MFKYRKLKKKIPGREKAVAYLRKKGVNLEELTNNMYVEASDMQCYAEGDQYTNILLEQNQYDRDQIMNIVNNEIDKYLTTKNKSISNTLTIP